jgi:hypothetical protein
MNTVQLGKENWKQFSILVIINAFVGGMIGLERSVLPQLAEKFWDFLQNGCVFIYHCLWYHEGSL